VPIAPSNASISERETSVIKLPLQCARDIYENALRIFAEEESHDKNFSCKKRRSKNCSKIENMFPVI
jgi:hypothetical protein